MKTDKMDPVGNFTLSSWQSTIDHLRSDIDAARDLPPWAVAVITLCAISTFVALIACGWGGLLLLSHVSTYTSKLESNRRLLNSDSAQQLEKADVGAVEDEPPKQSEKRIGNRRLQDSLPPDDAEL